MSGETIITVIGNLTNDPELRFTPSGSAVANFTIASTPRTFDRQANEWKDGETLFLRAAIWREPAENVAATLTKGMRIIATGRLKSRTYDTKEGEKRTVIELEVDEIGPSLRYAQARVQRTQNTGQQQQGNANNYNAAQGGGYGTPQGGGFGGPQQGGGFGGGQQRPPQGQQQRPQTGPDSQWGNQQHAAQPQPQGGAQQPGGWPGQTVQNDDPWATPGVANAGGWGGNQDGEPPF